jgi:hypothetical protein
MHFSPMLPGRFAVLATTMLSTALNQVMWLTYAPIATSAAGVLGVSLSEINGFSIAVMATFVPGAW